MRSVLFQVSGFDRSACARDGNVDRLLDPLNELDEPPNVVFRNRPSDRFGPLILRLRFRLAKPLGFLAEYSRGKSELINALFFSSFKERLLPSDVGRTTMCPLTSGANPLTTSRR